MSELVSQHCRSCGRDFYTSRVDGSWKRLNYAMLELTLHGSRRCSYCKSKKLDKAIFDNGGMFPVKEEVCV